MSDSKETPSKKILILATVACAYPGADAAGQGHMSYPANTYVIRVPSPVLFPESFYLLTGLGYYRCLMPGSLEKAVDEVDRNTDLNRFGIGLDIFGMYFPFRGDNNIAGFAMSSFSEFFISSEGHVDVHIYSASLSDMYFFGRLAGNGFFLRADIGLCGGISRASGGSLSYSNPGVSVLAGAGYGIPVFSGTRLLFNVSYGFKYIEDELFHQLYGGLGFLF